MRRPAWSSRPGPTRPSFAILTGDPAGVGPIRRGQIVHATIDGFETLEVTFAA